MSNRVKVEIYGQSYFNSGDLDEGYAHDLSDCGFLRWGLIPTFR